jgi:hypothetical protein
LNCPIIRDRRNTRQSASKAWLSLDHLWLPLDKSPVKKTRTAGIQPEIPGRIE